MNTSKRKSYLLLIPLITLLLSFKTSNNPIPRVMQAIVNLIIEKGETDRFKDISQQDLLTYIDPASLRVLASEYWTFEVNQDVEVLVCRDIQQKEIPFWLLADNFERTNEFIKNENVNYEVWRKVFKRGKVNLGINGFDRHRYVYFVALKPLNTIRKLEIKAIWPVEQDLSPLEIGSYTYRDWDELTISGYSTIFKNTFILPTYRGRSREAHLISAFRTTDYPATNIPDQILLSWKGNPKTTQHISWRTDLSQSSAKINYWKENSKDTLQVSVLPEVIEDVLLINDPIVNRFAVNLNGLIPDSKYQYQIISNTHISPIYNFNTASISEEFEFGWFGDMHNDSRLEGLIPSWIMKYPNARFYLQAGDLVNTGLYRDQWDQLLNATKAMTDNKSFMVVPGNHDSQEALHPSMYLSYFKFLENGPQSQPKGLSYHFDYGNTLFLMIDAVTLKTEDQLKWIEETLSKSEQKFKIVTFHFAPHTFESSYPDIIELWDPIFKKHGVDLVFNGHFHYYHRTNSEQKPMYVMSVSTKGKGENIQVKAGEFYAQKGYLYQHVKIKPNELNLTSVDSLGNIIDQFKLIKN